MNGNDQSTKFPDSFHGPGGLVPRSATKPSLGTRGLSASFLVALLALGSVAMTPAARPDGPSANSLSDEALLEIKFDQNIGREITAALPFQDEKGRAVTLEDYLDRKPVILVLGYYECPMLCNQVLNGLIECLQELKPDVDDRFELVFVSIDPDEKPSLAAAKKATYLKRYARSGAEDGWHFLTGPESSIVRLAEETGVHFAYDERLEEYAHPSGLIILTPTGRIAQYLFGIALDASQLNACLKDAGAERTGTAIEQFILLCFQYSPLRGPYGDLVMRIVRASAVVTLLGLAGVMACVGRRRSGRSARRSCGNSARPASGKERIS